MMTTTNLMIMTKWTELAVGLLLLLQMMSIVSAQESKSLQTAEVTMRMPKTTRQSRPSLGLGYTAMYRYFEHGVKLVSNKSARFALD